ncbi:MAG: exodeoxyribonuclease I [Gammaproteobacteria bacterium]
MADTFYWHDYETFGTDPRRDRAAQFAGIRTDSQLNPIGEPLVVYCKPAADYLPQPEACLITGITPQIAWEKGKCEAEFIESIHREMARSNTCTAGYNNIRFDDEVTRNLLYRNFYDPYAREWQGGNSRWDIIDLVRAARALRPEGIEWPVREDGSPSFRLEDITAANGIEHRSAHDALSDVLATIELAKLIKKAQSRLFHFVYEHRSKQRTMELLQLGSHRPILHVSGRYPSRQNCLAVVWPVCRHPVNNNGVVVYDLSVDPEPLLTLAPEEIKQRLFTANEDLPEGVERIPLKTVHINKCPVLAPVNTLKDKDAERLEVDLARCQANLKKLLSAKSLKQKLSSVFTREFDPETDPDLMIYGGGFFNDADRSEMVRIRTAKAEELKSLKAVFIDPRLPEMLFRYRARNFPETLNSSELSRWQEFCRKRLTDPEAGGGIVLGQYFEQLERLLTERGADSRIIDQLFKYGEQISGSLGDL